jgi:hypothetical protein
VHREYDRAREVSPTKRGLAFFGVALAGSAVLGAIAGVIWGAVAPRPLFQEVSVGAAQLVNAESSAFIAADAWFCLIGAVGGLIIGLAGWRLLIRRGDWPATAGLVLGAVGAGYLALYIGQTIGRATYFHQLSTAAAGTYFHANLLLGAQSALAFWPLLAGAVILIAAAGGPRGSGLVEAPAGQGGQGGARGEGFPPEAGG